jgi:CDP-4-dehydro-6-deoxyglucose reductase, E3
MLKAKLLGWRKLAPEVHHFDFEVPSVETLQFTPGQFISVVEEENGKEVTRAYSIASPRDGNRFSLCLNRVPNGLLSPYIFSLPIGAEITIHEPLGYFTLRHPGRRIVFIATGTGVAPFRSILLDEMPRLNSHITLLFGVRYPDGLLYRDEFEELSRHHPNFRFLPTVTRPDDSWTGRRGRVLEHLDEALDLKTPEEQAVLDVYICGLKEMVDDVRANLKARGFDRKQLIYEKYD